MRNLKDREEGKGLQGRELMNRGQKSKHAWPSKKNQRSWEQSIKGSQGRKQERGETREGFKCHVL